MKKVIYLLATVLIFASCGTEEVKSMKKQQNL